jgi:hypothetical protein
VGGVLARLRGAEGKVVGLEAGVPVGGLASAPEALRASIARWMGLVGGRALSGAAGCAVVLGMAVFVSGVAPRAALACCSSVSNLVVLVAGVGT